jgi:hypothetical protein
MNQHSKEIKEWLKDFCKKFGVKKGIMMFQEKDIDDPKLIKSRVLLFDPNLDKAFSEHDFAELIEGCLDVSKTLRGIFEHMQKHMIKVIESLFTMEDRIRKAKKSKPN